MTGYITHGTKPNGGDSTREPHKKPMAIISAKVVASSLATQNRVLIRQDFQPNNGLTRNVIMAAIIVIAVTHSAVLLKVELIALAESDFTEVANQVTETQAKVFITVFSKNKRSDRVVVKNKTL